jgi:hypothetical protein
VERQLIKGEVLMPTLDAGSQPPVGVATPSQLAMYVGDAPRQLLIFTGIAVPEYASEDLSSEEVIVRLGASTSENFEWTAEVGLASIGNDDSDFTFAANSSSVDTDPADGTLRLHVPIAVQGDGSVLHRFSYSVHVLSDPIRAKVTGFITWARYYGDPTFAVLNGGNPMFRVAVGQLVSVPGQPGGPGQAGTLGSTRFIENTAGFSSMPVMAGDRWVAAYEVDDVPLGQVWIVQPTLLGNALVGPPSSYSASPDFLPMPQTVQLTPSVPSASGVDFTMQFSETPH